VLIAARVGGGVAAGLLYPITLSLITGLFRGGARTRAIALWSGIGGGCSALGPLLGGTITWDRPGRPALVELADGLGPAGRQAVPQAQAEQLVAAAQQAFVDGKTAAIMFAVIASLIGLVLVLFLYPNKQDEEATYARVAERQPHPRRDARPEPEPDPGAQAAEPDVPP
jgi:MFS family permease